MLEQIPASRCPRCARVLAPAVRFCPYHPVEMEPTTVGGIGEIVTFTTLFSAPEGFRSPLHIAIVELDSGARFFCHGEATKGIRIGSRVSIEAVNHVYYFAHLGALERARIFWRRAGDRSERIGSIVRSWTKRLGRGRGREAEP